MAENQVTRVVGTVLTSLQTQITDNTNGIGNIDEQVDQFISEMEAGSGSGASAIPAVGARGNLAGYSTPVVKDAAFTVDKASPDDMIVSRSVTITVANGESVTSWCKTIAFLDGAESSTINFGNKWSWAVDAVPSISPKSVMVLYWNSTFGVIDIVAAG